MAIGGTGEPEACRQALLAALEDLAGKPDLAGLIGTQACFPPSATKEQAVALRGEPLGRWQQARG